MAVWSLKLSVKKLQYYNGIDNAHTMIKKPKKRLIPSFG